ncbi:MAG: hypothetical protein BWK80_48505 [Desulfobacteraceae bacterium IS3]|nr:MAG: hypothetical protein BWK80_48505 [Desulfobacteraceae bacterium IS3]
MPKRLLTRSENMARIRNRDTKPELLLRKSLWAAGCRYRLYCDLPGRPDLAFLRERLAVFVDGCFWHGCPVHYTAPRTREQFWKSKLANNVRRDMAADEALISQGWRVIHVWQHELKDIDAVVKNIRLLLDPSDSAVYSQENTIAVMKVSEQTASYGFSGRNKDDETNWYACGCGSSDVRVLAVNGHGSLRPSSRQSPESAELICRTCRNIWTAQVFFGDKK